MTTNKFSSEIEASLLGGARMRFAGSSNMSLQRESVGMI